MLSRKLQEREMLRPSGHQSSEQVTLYLSWGNMAVWHFGREKTDGELVLQPALDKLWQ